MATQRNNPTNSKSIENTQRNNPNISKSMKKKKRQPLSDISNFNLIPTSTLRKLCSSSSASSSIRKLATSVSGSDSNTSKPNNNYTGPNSETSAASSSFISVQNPNPVHVSTRRGLALLPVNSSTAPTGRSNEAVVYNRRQTSTKSNLETTALPFTSSHENKKDKRKEIDAPSVSLPRTVMKNKRKAIAEPFSSLSPEIKEDKGKGVAILSTPVSGNKAVVYSLRQTAKRSSLEATAPPLTSSCENKKDKRKEIDEPFLSLPPKIIKDKGKAIAEPFTSLSPESKEDKGKGVVVLSNPVSGIIKDKGKAIAEPFTSLSPEAKEDKGKGVVVLSNPVSGNKKTKAIHEPFMSSSSQTVKAQARALSHEHLPSDEKAAEENFGVSSRSCSSLKKTRGKGRADPSSFSCPTLPKRRTNRNESSGAGDIKPAGSWTDPNGKRKKRRCTGRKPASEESLPQDFVNYWREHFKEIDEFELPEEEASYSDLE